MEKAAKIFTVVIVIELLLISTGIYLNLIDETYIYDIENYPTVYIEAPVPLEPRNHDLSRVEDLFIAFEYEHNTSCTFVMTQNFTELTIVIQHNWRLENGTGYRPEIEIDGPVKIVEYKRTHKCPTMDQLKYEIKGLRYNATYTLTFTGGRGVAMAV